MMVTEQQKINFLGMSRTKLEAFFQQMGEKAFRANQLMQWIHQEGVTDFHAMTNISKVLRSKLDAIGEIRLPEVISEQTSADGTRKWAIRVASGSVVETVFIPEDGRGTLCVSSQAGCSLDCSFCSTGKQGFNSDLTAAEIIGQIWLANQSFHTFGNNQNRVVTNVVFMGMGEPLLNFDNVVDAMNLMMEDFAYGLSKRRVTISTAGVVPALERLADVTDVSLAVSLHAPNDELRDKLVPLNKKYTISVLMKAVHNYMARLADKRVVTIEYTLISAVNDHRAHARELAELLRNMPCKINLIPFNPFPLSDYKRSTDKAIANFRKILSEAGFTVTVRTTRGEDIDAACGQLAGQVNDRTRRNARYLALRDITKQNTSTNRAGL